MAQSSNLNYKLLSAVLLPRKLVCSPCNAEFLPSSARSFSKSLRISQNSSVSTAHIADVYINSSTSAEQSVTEFVAAKPRVDPAPPEPIKHLKSNPFFQDRGSHVAEVSPKDKNTQGGIPNSLSRRLHSKTTEPDWIPLEKNTATRQRQKRPVDNRTSRPWDQNVRDSRSYRRLPLLSRITVHENDPRNATQLRRKEKPDRDEDWKTQKDALSKKFKGDAWNPKKRLSPDALEGIRSLHTQDPEKFSTANLAEQFKISPESIRRILKSKWKPSPEETQDRRERWSRRHDRLWDHQHELGLKPARKKDKAQEDPDQFERDLVRREALGEI